MSEFALTDAGPNAGKRARRYRRGTSKLLALGTTTLALGGLIILGSSVSAFAAATVTLTITPSTGLTNGAAVTLTASGLTDTSPGNVLECNSDPSQPTVMVGGVINHSVPVSCTAPSLSAVVTTSATGTLSSTFHVVQGTVGPPCGPAPAAATCPATDSANQSPTADAALYPCPPTAAQQTAGDVCTVTYGDAANDSAMGNISFASSTPPTTTATTTAPKTAATTVTTQAPATTSATAPAPGTLATTGPGRGVGWLAVIGAALVLFGLLLLLVLLNIPQRAYAGIFERDGIRPMRPPRQRDQEGSFLSHGVSAARQGVSSASSWVGMFDQVGRKVGNGVSDAPEVARGLTARAVSVSVRTATWLLGR